MYFLPKKIFLLENISLKNKVGFQCLAILKTVIFERKNYFSPMFIE